MYVKKTEKPSQTLIQARGAFSSCLKVRVMVVRGQEGLALKLLDASPVFPSFLELTTRGLPLKPGQVLEVVLACVKDKWCVKIPCEQIYETLSFRGGPLLSDNELLLAKLNLAPKGREASILDKFFTASLWAKRLLVMGILNKKTPAELALLNAYAFLQAPQPNTKELSDLLKTPLKAKQVKGSSLYWFIMPFECEYASSKKRGSLNLAFREANFTYQGLHQWSLIFPLKDECLILQVREVKPRYLLLSLPLDWLEKETALTALKECLRKQGLGNLTYQFLGSPSHEVDAWQEEFGLNE